jgi:hypothetical protein
MRIWYPAGCAPPEMESSGHEVGTHACGEEHKHDVESIELVDLLESDVYRS